MMSDQERLGAALAIAVFVHFMGLQAHWTQSEAVSSGQQTLVVELSAVAVPSQENGVMALDSLQEPSPEDAAADMRRKARQTFVEEVSQAIHARRLLEGHAQLIGVALYSFVIDASGAFTDITLQQTSGKPELDRAAFRAIQAASGVVKRPTLLGTGTLQCIVPVKYQYTLQ